MNVEVEVQRDSGLMMLSSIFRLIFWVSMLYAILFILFVSVAGGLYRLIVLAIFLGFMRLYVHLVTSLQAPSSMVIGDDGLTIRFRKNEYHVGWAEIKEIEILRQFKRHRGVHPAGAIIWLRNPKGMQRRKFYRVDAVAAMEVLSAHQALHGQTPRAVASRNKAWKYPIFV